MDDIFCKIIASEVEERNFLYEDDDLVIINSKYPSAEHHFLVIPKKHIDSIVSANEEDQALIGKMFIAGKNFVAEKGIHDFKMIFNAGKFVEVPHLHLHILCGEMKNSH